MKIAVTYEDGNIFQHFGRTQAFKVYETEDGKVISGEVISSNGAGHGALAGVLAGNGIRVLICGGLGGGAQMALAEAGIEVVSGVTGNADEAVEAYLRGELESAGATCDHHHHEEGHACGDHGCGGHDADEGCGNGCGADGCEGREEGGGCAGCSGCGPAAPAFEGKNVGRICRVHYRGTFNDGSQFDSSYDRGEPLEFICGAGMMIRGFDAAVADMDPGQTVDVHLMPEEAYGMPDPNAFFTIEVSQLPGSEELSVGEQVYLQSPEGQPFPVKVIAREGATITFDANHEMAGKELNFRIELVEVR